MSSAIRKQREHEDQFRQNWVDRGVAYHRQYLTFSYPLKDVTKEITQSSVKKLIRERAQLNDDTELLTVNLVQLGTTFKIDVIIEYGHEDKGIVNLNVTRAINTIYVAYEEYFMACKVKIVTEYIDGHYKMSHAHYLKAPLKLPKLKRSD